jgi:endonuclease/exonuclease/phosphatase family metal-dependent hydrolase
MKILTWNVQWFKGLDGVVDIERVLQKAREIVGAHQRPEQFVLEAV